MQTVDTNSAHFAKYCFLLGMQLKRIEVIGDDAEEIGEAARRMSEKYDFVVTRYALCLAMLAAAAPLRAEDLLSSSKMAQC